MRSFVQTEIEVFQSGDCFVQTWGLTKTFLTSVFRIYFTFVVRSSNINLRFREVVLLSPTAVVNFLCGSFF